MAGMATMPGPIAGGELRAALVTPLTGSLGGFGRDGTEALALWADRAAELPPALNGVTLELTDAAGRPAEAMAEAAAGEPDLLFGPYGSGPARRACAATDRLVFNHGGATAALRRPEYGNVVNVPAPAATYLHGAIDAATAADPGLARAAVLHTDTGFAREVGEGAARHARDRGLAAAVTSCQPGEVAAAATEVAGADLLLVAGRFDDEIAALRALRGGPWRAAAFVGAGVDEVFAGLPDHREGLLGPAQWTAETAPAPDEGPDAAWFAAAFAERTGRPPSYPAAQAFAAGLIAARCVREAGTVDDAVVARAAGRLWCTTLYGGFGLDSVTGLQARHEVVTVQWQDGHRRPVWPPEQAAAALRHPLPAGPDG
jgi:branched-chain amino acid transport system substrate-binding protein